MHRVTYSMGTSLDGYITDREGSLDWSVPDPELLRHFNDEARKIGVHLMGRKLYETMLYWETVDDDDLDEVEREWKALWNPLPKVVFSTTLTSVEGNARLLSGGLAEEIARLRDEPGDGEIAIGGAELAAQVAALDLIDEYNITVHPALLGGGATYFPQDARRADLELIESKVFGSGVVLLRYRVRH